MLADCLRPKRERGSDGECGRCTAFGFEPCNDDGTFGDPIQCVDGEVCINDFGCAECRPGSTYCDGDTVYECNDDGTGGGAVETCEGDLVCSDGDCKTACDRADDEPSNVGCHFWAVDLDNEAYESTFGGGFGSNDAAAEQFAVAVANNGSRPATVNVFRNIARVGESPSEEVVETRTIAPGDLEQIDLDQREVDGTMGQNGTYALGSGSHTFVSPHAYRIESNEPVVAYQFNPIIQKFSNDASILIPRQALGVNYYVLGWPTANFCGEPEGGMLHQRSVPDRTSITIIGTEDGTQVTVNPTHPIVGSGGDSGFSIPASPAGTPISFTVNRYDVVNLESDQPEVSIFECLNFIDRDGDFTGSQVTSSKPVAVFSGSERSLGTGGADIPDPPHWTPGEEDECCTDHFEEQMFPTTALGREFAVTRSPVRSQMAGYKEPDLYRILATRDGTEIFTTLAAPNDRFSLSEGEHVTFAADEGFTVSSQNHAIMFAQYLVSQGRVPGGIGDPTFIIFPATEQHRDAYVYLVPETFQDNYAVFAAPESATLMVDNGPLPTACTTAPVGIVNTIPYAQITCPMAEGTHTVSADMPFGLTVYGYYSVGSYGYPGGSDVEIINPIE